MTDWSTSVRNVSSHRKFQGKLSVGSDETTFVIGLKRKLGLARTESNTIAAISKHILFRGWYRNPIIIKTQLCLQPHKWYAIFSLTFGGSFKFQDYK